MKYRRILFAVQVACVAIAGMMNAMAAAPSLRFISPANGQTVVTLSGVAAYAQPQAGRSLSRVEFNLYNQTRGEWWDGDRYIGQSTNVVAATSGTNWIIQSKDLVPLCCGQMLQITAKATDNAGEFATAAINVQVDEEPPVIGIAPLQQDQVVTDLSALGGTVTDNFGGVAGIEFSIYELSLDYGPGRYWNGSQFQDEPATLPGQVQGTQWMPAAGVRLPTLNSGQRYEITAVAMDSVSNSASASLTVQARMTELAWDPGETLSGTVLLQNPNTNGGNYVFKIVAQSSLAGAWRTALNVTAGEADLYLRNWEPPTLYSHNFDSAHPGSDGCVIPSEDYQDGEAWYILVHANPEARWSLLSGEVFVHDLGLIAPDDSSSTNVTIGAEGMAFFKTTAVPDMQAWRLWLRGSTRELLVRKSKAAHALYTDLRQEGQMLVVPPYLTDNALSSTLFISVSGTPGARVDLDSREHRILDLQFNSTIEVVAGADDFPYVTYRVQVPVEQIAWQLNLLPAGGTPNIAVRRDRVPNEWRNDAFSETPEQVGASVTLVPPPPNSSPETPGLTDGTFFVTVYSTGPFMTGFQNITPTITDVHYEFQVTNDDPNRAGWRYYRVVNAAEQLGSLGWELLLNNQAPGTQIALRRNAVPGAWMRRDNDRYHEDLSEGNLDYSGAGGFLQRPGHQADIWYIGVYTPDAALGQFVLKGQKLIGEPLAFDGAGSSVAAENEPAGKWRFFRVDVPANALGWDVRLNGISQGAPRFVVSRDVLPATLESLPCWSWCWFHSADKWPTGYQWESGSDWTGCANLPMLVLGMGSPLEAGTYYIGVQSPASPASYTFQSRGIGLTNFAIGVRDLEYSLGTINGTVAAGEMAIYRVNIPSNTPNWKLQLSVSEGEALLKVQKDSVPGSTVDYYNYGAVFEHRQGQLMDKWGGEEWLLMPNPEQAMIAPGNYYVLVAGQGTPTLDCPPVGATRYEIKSSVASITTLSGILSYGQDLTLAVSQRGGETRPFQFTVPDGIASIEVSLENTVGNPRMFLNQGAALVGTSIPAYSPANYGNFGGTNAAWWDEWRNDDFLTAANPRGLFNLTIHASGDGSRVMPDASYTLRVRAVPPTSVAFDGGAAPVNDQPAGQWHFFQVDVPEDALGWELRLAGVTEGNPQFVVTREVLPSSMVTQPCGWGSCWYDGATNWSSGHQVTSGAGWGGCGGPILSLGMGNPLEPGTYFIGVRSELEECSYILESRGIGLLNYTYRVRDLDFSSGVVNGELGVLEPAYFRVQVPSGTPNWKLRLTVPSGEALMKVHYGSIPRNLPATYDNYSAVFDGWGGHLMAKDGGEEWLLMPRLGTNEVPPGTYYVLVAGQGDTAGNECGAGNAQFELASGTEPVIRLPGTLDYANDLVFDGTQRGGETKLYQFEVPANVASIEVALENRVGEPVMYFNRGPNLVSTAPAFYSSDPYGNYGGTNYLQRAEQKITVVNPAGLCSLTVVASTLNGEYPDAGYLLRVRAVPPAPVAFDGGTVEVTEHPAELWRFFQVDVPEDALGWDLRLTNITGGNPQFVVTREVLPSALYSTPCYWSECWYDRATNWPAGYQWRSGSAWDNCGDPVLAMSMGNPLEPGTYFIGILNTSGTASYTLASRGVGLANYSIRVRDLDFADGSDRQRLSAQEPAYYRVQVPSNAPNWKLRLTLNSGEALLKVQKDVLPRSVHAPYNYGAIFDGRGGQRMAQSGAEEWLMMPDMYNTNHPMGGTYYAVVASQGQNAEPLCGGTGEADFELSSGTEPVIEFPDLLTFGNELVLTNTQRAGEMKLYRFAAALVPALEVRLENRVGNPLLFLGRTTNLIGTALHNYYLFDYGHFGGEDYAWQDPNIINVPNPEPGIYSLSILASDISGVYLDASYVLRIRVPAMPAISFSREVAGGGITNRASGVLGDGQRAFYQVEVPAEIDGAPVLGWKLDLAVLSGSPSVRVRKDLLPDSGCETSTYATESTIIAPPYLSPGTWYVDVKSTGNSQFTLASHAITTNTLARGVWAMPAVGTGMVAPGLSMPVFGDTGIAADGTTFPDDQGIDLEQGQYHLYAVWVPTNNAGLLRTELRAISGNPNLYLRTGFAPTYNHNSQGSCSYEEDLVERRLTGNTTEYGNWVPMNGKKEAALKPGLWVFSVQAAGNANARYRLRLSCGNPTPGGLVQDLTFNGGSYANQHLNGGDWRYFRVVVPPDAPTNWTIAWSRSLGSARMFIRDTLPPGEGRRVADYSDSNYNPDQYYHPDLQTWKTDSKNQGPYPRFDTPGSIQLPIPPVRPGSVYYLGFWSLGDTTFSVSSSASGPALDPGTEIPFLNGEVSRSIPAHGVARYYIDAPAEATRLKFSSTHSANVRWFLEQGTPAYPGGPAHWLTYENDTKLDKILGGEWPWIAGARYYLCVTNTSDAAQPFALRMADPVDLEPVAFLLETNLVSSLRDPTVTLIFGVTNRSSIAATGPWYDYVLLSTNGILDTNSTYLQGFDMWRTSIPAHGSYWHTSSVALPLGASGSYTLFVVADARNAVYETNEKNNAAPILQCQFVLTPSDLKVVDFAALAPSSPIVPSPIYTLAWSLTNMGIGRVEVYSHDRVWLSTNGVLDENSVSAGTFYRSQPIEPGGVVRVTNSVMLPIQNHGTYTLFVQTDINNRIAELRDDNNVSAALTVDVTPVMSNCVTAPYGLVAWWPGDGHAQDLIGNRHGQTVNGAAYASGAVRQGFAFDGLNDSVQVPDSPAWAFGTNAFTIELWVNFSSIKEKQALVACSQGPGSVNKWILWMNYYSMALHLNEPAGAIDIGGVYVSSEPGRWYHVALTRHGSKFSFYVDGELKAIRSHECTVPDAAAPLTIGSAEGAFFFDGFLDEVSIYDRALLQAEIGAIYRAGSAGKCHPEAAILAFDMTSGALEWTPGGLRMRLSGMPVNTPVVIDASTNLEQWTPIHTNNSATGFLDFLDPRAQTELKRFYRAREVR